MVACLRDTSLCATTTSHVASRPIDAPAAGIGYSLPATSDTSLPPVPLLARAAPQRLAAAAAAGGLAAGEDCGPAGFAPSPKHGPGPRNSTLSPCRSRHAV